MTKENKPEMRFSGFNEDWKQRKVKELCSISTGKSNTQDKVDDGEYPFYVRSPIVERSKKYLYDEEAVLTVGDGVGTGKVFHYVNGKYDLHQRCYRMFNFSEELNAKYFYHIFSKMFYKRVMSMTAKTSVDSVRMDMIADMEIPVPNIKEQEKIGAFFSDIDNLITLQQRKLELLKNQKKAFLEKMFPKEGENVPEIRFSGFSDAWKQRKFGDSFDFLQNNTLSRASLNDTSGCAKNVHYGDILVKFGESISAEKADLPFICEREILKKLSKSILKNGDVVIADTAEDMTTGKSCEIVDVDECMPVLAGLHTIPVRPKQKFGKYYLGYYLNSEAFHSQLIPLIQGIKVYSISKSSIKDTVVMFPDDVQEQEKIGSLFNRIDNTITLQQRKLEILKNIKKSFLQKMFV